MDREDPDTKPYILAGNVPMFFTVFRLVERFVSSLCFNVHVFVVVVTSSFHEISCTQLMHEYIMCEPNRFMIHLHEQIKYDRECNIMALVYINRITTANNMALTAQNWRMLWLIAVMVAQKVRLITFESSEIALSLVVAS